MVAVSRYAWLVPWLVAAAAGAVLVSSLFAQVRLQASLHTAMRGVLANVTDAGVLTRRTARAMAPMVKTTRTMGTMNERLRRTRSDLIHMNETLERILGHQRAMLVRVGAINRTTAGVAQTLGAIDGQNRALLHLTVQLSNHADGQAAAIAQLSALTADSINHLRTINRRLAFFE